MKYEYAIHVWGGFFNKKYKKIHKQKPGYYWFDNFTDRDFFLKNLKKISDNLNAKELVFDNYEGFETRIKTIAEMDFIFENRIYHYTSDFGYNFKISTIKYMFEEGNHSCDCNRSLFIQREIDKNFPELDCGNLIEMRNLDVYQIYGTNQNFEERE